MKEVSNPIIKLVNHHVTDYPTPVNINHLRNSGSSSASRSGIQIVTGISSAMNHTPNVDLATASVEHIMRDVDYGRLMRYIHANGASTFPTVAYIHIARGLHPGSHMSPKELPWLVGVVIPIPTMATASTGYVSPWGQTSFRGATVITNLFSVIPVYGTQVANRSRGAYNVGNATSNRFSSLHHSLPLAIAGATLVHLAYVHKDGSNNPPGINGNIDKIPSHPYSYTKDSYSSVPSTTSSPSSVSPAPNPSNHPDNYIEANPPVTPPHIVPEWYSSPYHATSRPIPHKAGGIVATGAASIVPPPLPSINTSEIRSSASRPSSKKSYWSSITDCLILGWIGGQPVESPYIEIGQIATVHHLAFLLIIIPFSGYFEKFMLRQRQLHLTQDPKFLGGVA